MWRPGSAGPIEVAVVHRPRRRDWSLPKGKRQRDESLLECAVREVREETGLDCVIGGELTTVQYRHRSGRQKVVRYWEMRAVGGSFRPNDEVDALRWVPIADVHDVLTRPRDATVIDRFADRFADWLADGFAEAPDDRLTTGLDLAR